MPSTGRHLQGWPIELLVNITLSGTPAPWEEETDFPEAHEDRVFVT